MNIERNIERILEVLNSSAVVTGALCGFLAGLTLSFLFDSALGFYMSVLMGLNYGFCRLLWMKQKDLHKKIREDHPVSRVRARMMKQHFSGS